MLIQNPKSKIQNGIVWRSSGLEIGPIDSPVHMLGCSQSLASPLEIKIERSLNSHGDRWGKIGAKSNAVPQL